MKEDNECLKSSVAPIVKIGIDKCKTDNRRKLVTHNNYAFHYKVNTILKIQIFTTNLRTQMLVNFEYCDWR